jgi:hypothetical protein
LLQDRQYELGHLTEQYNAHKTFAELVGVQPGTCCLELTVFIRFADTAPDAAADRERSDVNRYGRRSAGEAISLTAQLRD